jgi:predicted RNA-binding Zn ribbon-like protein
LFFDTSRNGRRAWCDMKTCGNLAKVRRFRSKQKTQIK